MNRLFKSLNYLVVSIMLVVLLLIVSSTVFYYNQQKKFVLSTIEKDLQTIVKLKSIQVSNWYADELLDTWTIAHNIHLLRCISNFQRLGTPESIENLLSFLTNLKLEHDYENIYLLNSEGKLLLGTNYEEIELDSEVIQAYLLSKKLKSPVSTNIYQCGYCSHQHLDFLSIVENDKGECIGGLLFHIDPEKHLFPIVNNWPVSYNTGQVLLLSLQEGTLHFMNKPKDSAYNSTQDRKTEKQCFTKIINEQGLSRIIQGFDFAGKEVVAYAEKIEGTSWIVSAKINQDEIQVLYKNKLTSLVIILTLLLFVVLLIVTTLLVVNQKNYYKKQVIAQKEFEIVLKSIGDAVITTDKSGKVQYLNPMAEQLTGWKLSEASQLHIDQVFRVMDEESLQKTESPVETVLRAGTAVDLSNHTILTSKSGKQMPIADSGAPIANDNGEILGVVMVFRDQTKEYEHRKEVEENARLLTTLFANLPGMAYRCKNDREWTMEFVSEKCYELTGYTSDELQNNHLVSYNSIIDSDFEESIWEKVQEAVKSRSPFEFEYRIKTRQDTLKWVWERGCGIYNDKGELLYLEGFISDITILKNAMQALTQSEEKYRVMMENLNDLIVNVDSKNQFTFVSPSYCNLFGKSPDDLLGKSFMPMVHPDDQQLTTEQMQKLFEPPYTCFIEQRAMTVKGWRWLAWSDKAVVDPNGNVLSIVGVGRDITARKLAESEMQKLSKAVIQSPVIIVITDPRGYIEYVNPKFTEATGYESFEVLGKTPSILKSGNHPKEFYQELWETILGGHDWKGEINNRKKNGEIYWENAIISPILNEKGKIIHFVAVKEDITEKKLMIRELVEAKERAEQADRLKSSFLANMSHEIRTPLNSIIGFTSFIVSDEKYLNAAEKERYFEIISKNADNLLQIINDIIDLSRLETGQLVVNKKPFKMKSLIDSLHAVFSRKLDEVNKFQVELIADMEYPELEIYTDENRLSQIFGNLISNAVKFTNKGKICFGIETVNASHIHFYVSDTGIGIEGAMQRVVFERFRQVEDSHTRSYGGNGLGLSIVKYLVELLGGNVTLNSELGQGSIFRFSIHYKPESEQLVQ